MIKKFDDLFFKHYDRRNYNCAHFVCEAWLFLKGDDIGNHFSDFFKPISEASAKFSKLKFFKKLKTAESPCIVLFQRKSLAPHVGIYINGKVLHIQPRGVEFQPIEVVTGLFNKVSFYTYDKDRNPN